MHLISRDLDIVMAILAVLAFAGLAQAFSPAAPRSAARLGVKRDAVLNAPRKDDSWYEGLSVDPGAAGRVPEAAAAFVETIKTSDVTLQQCIDVIDEHFTYHAVKFDVGKVTNFAGMNAKSGKVLSYAALTGLDTATTLKCFGPIYDEVRADPDGTSHANIRALMAGGVESVRFPNGLCLTAKLVDDDEDYTSEKGLAASSKIGEGDDWDVDSDIWIPVDGVSA